MAAAAPPTYDIACPCGARLRGSRRARHQVVPCPACGASRFVLPISPLPEASEPPTAAPARRGPWLIAGALLAAVAGVAALVVMLNRNSPHSPDVAEPPSEARLTELLKEGTDSLGEGAYLRATQRFEAALVMGERLGRPQAERRRIGQLLRQAALLADLLAESPAEIARHAAGLPADEWAELFRRRYAGRSLILDDTISRAADGHFQCATRIAAPDGGEVRLELTDLTMLRDLPLVQPRRLLLGLRLAGLRREKTGWALLPAPDSGVLLTDPETFGGLSLPADAEVREVLRRQRAWLEP